jgi:hypothetical protein
MSSPSSANDSITGVMFRPSLHARITVSMYSSSLNPLQTIGIERTASSPSAVRASTASSSGLLPASSPNPSGAAVSRRCSTNCRCWFTLIG